MVQQIALSVDYSSSYHCAMGRLLTLQMASGWLAASGFWPDMFQVCFLTRITWLANGFRLARLLKSLTLRSSQQPGNHSCWPLAHWLMGSCPSLPLLTAATWQGCGCNTAARTAPFPRMDVGVGLRGEGGRLVKPVAVEVGMGATSGVLAA